MRDGRLWCPPRAASALIDLIVDRDARMPGAIVRAARLARLLHLVDGVVYWGPLYRIDGQPLGLARLSSDSFRRLCTGVVSAAVTVGRDGVTFHEQELGTRHDGKSADAVIAFGSMPVLAGLLRVLHDALGLDVVSRELAALLTHKRPQSTAHDVGNRLARMLDAWLTEHLDTSHQMRQARAIRAFLATRKVTHALGVDDTTILAFWQEQARQRYHTDQESFRLYTSTARKLIQYRGQMRLHEVQKQIVDAIEVDDRHEIARDMRLPDTDDWTSPAAELTRLPAGRVKWLTGAERKRLQNYLGHSEGTSIGEVFLARGRGAGSLGLSPGHPYDIFLAGTLLRADVFGDVQGRIIQGLRDGLDASALIDAAIDGVGANTYEQLCESYQELRRQVRETMLATVSVLARHGRAEAVLLMRALDQSAALTELMRHVEGCTSMTAARAVHPDGADSAFIGAHIGAVLKDATNGRLLHDDGELNATLDRARKTFQHIRRIGFDDATAMRDCAAYLAAVDPLLRLDRELERLDAALAKPGSVTGVMQDAQIFRATFQWLYQTHALPSIEFSALVPQNEP